MSNKRLPRPPIFLLIVFPTRFGTIMVPHWQSTRDTCIYMVQYCHCPQAICIYMLPLWHSPWGIGICIWPRWPSAGFPNRKIITATQQDQLAERYPPSLKRHPAELTLPHRRVHLPTSITVNRTRMPNQHCHPIHSFAHTHTLFALMLHYLTRCIACKFQKHNAPK